MLKIKMGHLPGDIPIADKAAMMEGRGKGRYARKMGKAFRRDVLRKVRTILKQRTNEEIKLSLDP